MQIPVFLKKKKKNDNYRGLLRFTQGVLFFSLFLVRNFVPKISSGRLVGKELKLYILRHTILTISLVVFLRLYIKSYLLACATKLILHMQN